MTKQYALLRQGKKITSWTIVIWWDNKKEEYIDTSDMPDDLAEGIDNYLYEKLEVEK